MKRALHRLTLVAAVVAAATAPLSAQNPPPASPWPEVSPEEVFRSACDRLKALEAKRDALKGVADVRPSMERDDNKALKLASFVFERNVAALRKDDVTPKDAGKPFLYVSVSVWACSGPSAAPPANLMEFQWKGKEYAAWVRVHGSDEELVKAVRKAVEEPILSPVPAIKLENRLGFKTAGSAEAFRTYWDAVQDERKMKGKVSDHLTESQIDSVVMLEVNIAIPQDPRCPGLRDEVLGVLSEGNRFETGRLPDQFGKGPAVKYLVALFRTKKGDYGLVTRYRDIGVIEFKGTVGVVPVKADAGPAPPVPGSGKR
jgi:hypothetical protein